LQVHLHELILPAFSVSHHNLNPRSSRDTLLSRLTISSLGISAMLARRQLSWRHSLRLGRRTAHKESPAGW
jgi:hypothetical protein